MLKSSVLTPAGRLLVCLCLILLIAGCGKTSADSKKGSGKGGRGAQMVVPVAVSKADIRDLPVVLSGLGSVEAYNTVAVKSRIDGQLVQVAFREGQEVKQGD